MEDDEVSVRSAGWLVVLAGSFAFAGSAGAAPSAATLARHVVTVPDAAEAWYSTVPISTCTTPLGCSPTQTLVSPYPAGTLHVGVVVGEVIERSYVQPDLTRLPPGATATNGRMTLPVATSPTDGTVNVASAHLLACLATQPFTPKTAGSTQPPPGIDCVISATPSYDAAKSEIVVDLTPFLTAWNRGRPQDGIALIASPSHTDQSSLWQVTIDGLGQSGPAHVTSTLSYAAAPAKPAATAASSPPAVPSSVTSAPPVAAPVPPGVTTGPPPVSPPQVAAPQAPTLAATRPAAFRRGFQYPLAFLLPLLLLAGGAYFMRLFTSPVAAPRQRRTMP